MNFTSGTDISVTDRQTDRHDTQPDYHMPSFAHVHQNIIRMHGQPSDIIIEYSNVKSATMLFLCA